MPMPKSDFSHGNDNFKKQRTNFYSSLRGFEKTEVIHKKKFYYVWIASAINSLAHSVCLANGRQSHSNDEFKKQRTKP